MEINKELLFRIDNLWILMSAFLVFIMHLGFSCVETGMTRAKNTVNILFKNITIVGIGILSYALIGYALMYPGESWLIGKFFGLNSIGVTSLNAESVPTAENYAYWTDFIFQAMFAATAATIVSGAVSERIKLKSFIVFSTVLLTFIYPILGSWKWGGGWLDKKGFYDFAGSTLVHSVGGWAALAGVLLLGARTGKYDKGYNKAIPGHNMPLACIGMFLLWFGWYGFNGGSVLSADPNLIAYVAVTTTLAASAGMFGAMITSFFFQGKPDLTMLINGVLGGLVAITAGADTVSILSSVTIGFIGGILVVGAVILFDSYLKLDDPVGATSVHLVCGIWGTLAVGIFSFNPEHTFGVQFIGVVSYALGAFIPSLIIFTILHFVMGLRVKPEEEIRGLDISEHGIEAYPSMQIYSND